METFGFTLEQWTDLGISALILVVTVVLGRWGIRFLLNRVVSRLVSRTSTKLDDVVLRGLRSPLNWLVFVLAFQFGVDRLGFVPESWQMNLNDVYFLAYAFIGFVGLWRLVSSLVTWYGEEVAPRTDSELDEQLMPFFSRIAQIVLTLVGLIVILSHFEVDVSALITTLGVGSLAIALAAQATLADMISGFVIMIDRPFRIGDRIEIQDLDTWGDVVDIGLRSSRIRTRDNRMVIVPNSVIGKSLIVNYSYPSTEYRIQIHIGIAYGSDIELARNTMIEAVQNVEGVLKDKKVEALFLEFGDSAMIFRVRWWLDSYIDTRRMFDRVNTALYEALSGAGIEIPNLQYDVHHKFDAPEVRELTQAFQRSK